MLNGFTTILQFMYLHLQFLLRWQFFLYVYQIHLILISFKLQMVDGSFTVVRVGSSVGGSGSVAGPANVPQQVQNQLLVFAPASPVGPR